DTNAAFFGVTVDREDEAQGRIAQQLPGIRFFLDYTHEVSRLYRAASDQKYRPHWLLLDRELRVVRAFAIDEGEQAIALLSSRLAAQEDSWAPVITVPHVFEAGMGARLIELYRQGGGAPSGFMRDVDGKTTEIVDGGFKRRRDCLVEDGGLQKQLAARMHRRIVPAMQRAFHFTPTRIERYLVACYEAGAGYFRAHRDNTTMGTAHRRFAVTINLNGEDYE